MSLRLPPQDEQAVSRWIDDEMSAAERTEFAQRLDAEPELAAAVVAAEQVRGCFAGASAESGPAPSAGFADSVLQQARRLPSRDEFDEGTDAEPRLAGGGGVTVEWTEAATATRRALIAAALLLAAAVVVFGGLVRRMDSGRLQASPQELEQLDLRIEAERALDPGIRPR